MVSVEFQTAIPAHDLRYRKHEKVAALIGSRDGDVFTVRRCVVVPNMAHNRADHFELHVDVLRKFIGAMADDVIGAIHSHPFGDEMPSSDDLAGMPEGMIGGVLTHTRVTAWYMRNRPLDQVSVVFRLPDERAVC